MGTTLLRNGKVIDGTGTPAFEGHILIEGDRIKDVLTGTTVLPQADTIIDASGLAVAPGFIDAHSHLEYLLHLDDHPDLLKCQVEQGITTLVGGNCGFSPAPVTTEMLRTDSFPAVMLFLARDRNWRSMGEFLQTIQETKPIINLAQLVGHATVRVAAANTSRGPMKRDELRECLDKVQKALDEGSCGLSFGLGYEPGIYSPQEEVEAFSAVAAKAGKPVTVHLRAYSRRSYGYPPTYMKPHNLRALREMIEVAEHTGASLQVSHFMLTFRNSWSMVDECLKVIEDARSRGINIMMDAIPYSYVNGPVDATFSPSVLARFPQGYRSRWLRMRVWAEQNMVLRTMGYSMKYLQLLDPNVDGWKDLIGRTIDEIAREWKMSQSAAMLRIRESSKGQAMLLLHRFSGEPGRERAIDAIVSHNLCLIGSDAWISRNGYPHPAAFGTFPRVLGYYVREKKLFSIENAVRRMTSASADRFGLKDRGRLVSGKAADIIVFDPKSIAETPGDGKKPPGRPVGIHHVFLNGVHVVRDGAYVSTARAGRVLRV